MTNAASDGAAGALWACLNKGITGVQLLWATAQRLFAPQGGEGPPSLLGQASLLGGLMQTAVMESLLLRVARLMDPATTGRGTGERQNLSLNRLAESNTSLTEDVAPVIALWEGSGLKLVRNKYLSHNDLARSGSKPHTLNIPLRTEDIAALEALSNALREMRRSVHRKLTGVSYLDSMLDVDMSREVEGFVSSLRAADVFFELLPEHEALQQAWHGRLS